MYINNKATFDFDSFRTDVLAKEEFAVFKEKYGIKTRKEFDLKLMDLMRLDGTFYEYIHSPVVRGQDVYLSKDGFLKTASRVVDGYKEYLKVDQITFDDYEYTQDGLLLKIKVAQLLGILLNL